MQTREKALGFGSPDLTPTGFVTKNKSFPYGKLQFFYQKDQNKITSNSHGAPKKIEAVELKTFLRVPYHTCAADKSHAVSVGSTRLSRTRAADAAEERRQQHLAGSQGCYSPSPEEGVTPKARDCLLQNADGAEVKKPWCDLVYNIAFEESDILI